VKNSWRPFIQTLIVGNDLAIKSEYDMSSQS